MAATIMNDGKVDLLERFISGLPNYRLHQGESKPVYEDDDVIEDRTVANFSGYGGVQKGFTLTQLVSNKAVRYVKIVDFTHSGGATSNTIQGMHAPSYHLSNLRFFLQGPFDSSISMANIGDRISVEIKIDFTGES